MLSVSLVRLTLVICIWPYLFKLITKGIVVPALFLPKETCRSSNMKKIVLNKAILADGLNIEPYMSIDVGVITGPLMKTIILKLCEGCCDIALKSFHLCLSSGE